jgi:hypothetical protein
MGWKERKTGINPQLPGIKPQQINREKACSDLSS